MSSFKGWETESRSVCRDADVFLTVFRWFSGQCSHKSIPVEMDERMSPCDPDYGPHVCECNEQEGGMSRQREGCGGVLSKEDSRTDQRHPPTSTTNWWNPSVAGPTSVTPHRLPHFHQYDVNTSAYYHDPSDVSLEPPGPLISNCGPLVPQRYPVQKQGKIGTRTPFNSNYSSDITSC